MILLASLMVLASNNAFAATWQGKVDDLIATQTAATYSAIETHYLNPAAVEKWLQGCSDYQFTVPQSSRRLTGRVVVRANCLATRQRPLFVQVEVDATVRYLTATRDLLPGTAVATADFKVRTAKLSELPRQTLLLNPSQQREAILTDAVVTRSLTANTPVPEHALRRAYAVQHGDEVRVLYQGNGFQVEQIGAALGRGYIGDTLTVQMQNRHRVEVKIVGHGIAEVIK
ncbi:Flagella basal body P-ring formation protein FlgA [Pseudidiomarina piscicola]|uniref:Flagella basal body P-ring formation protein FlgA n=2 Tax=Pseudidiomarina piscicola TaxID=2614830 RepID=A0A6S6WNG9_9GAMM|nr:Flagella basal body P-ring formation protein FlgA [Pseudidiomarina piscicola]VZT40541.1 Flagella basal body P-ring formation protein FlgA [Pseudomonas aeruginosa]